MNPEPKLFNRNFIILCLVTLSQSMSFFLILPVMPLYLVVDLGVSKSLAGAVVSLYAIAALLARPISGYIVDSFQRRPVLIIATLGMAAACSGYIFLVNLLLFSLARFAHGAFFGVATTSSNTIAIDNMPPNKIGSGIGLIGVMVSLSMALAPMLGLTLMRKFSAHAAFVSSALIAALSVLLCMLVAAPKREIQPRKGTLLKPQNLFLREGLLPGMVYLLTIFSYGLVSNYLALLAHERELDASSGAFFLFLSAGLVLSRIFSGILMDKGYLAPAIIAGKVTIIFSFVYLLSGATSFNLLSSGLFLGLGFGLCIPAYQGLIISLSGPERRGTANSTFYLSMDMGIGLAVLSGGILADLTSFASVYMFGTMLVLMALLLFLIKIRPLIKILPSKN